jgi:hypothetical protein
MNLNMVTTVKKVIQVRFSEYHHRSKLTGSQDATNTSPHFSGAKASEALVAGLTTRVAAASVAPKPSQASAPAVSASTVPNPVKNATKDKVTYNITIADLENLEKKAMEKDMERPLRRHWTNFTFYFMASLSVVLPLLFLRK